MTRKTKIEPVERTIAPGYQADGVSRYSHNIASARLSRQPSTRQFRGMTLSHRIFVVEQGLRVLQHELYPTEKDLRDTEAKKKFLAQLYHERDLVGMAAESNTPR
jgi:hypothetical protein